MADAGLERSAMRFYNIGAVVTHYWTAAYVRFYNWTTSPLSNRNTMAGLTADWSATSLHNRYLSDTALFHVSDAIFSNGYVAYTVFYALTNSWCHNGYAFGSAFDNRFAMFFNYGNTVYTFTALLAYMVLDYGHMASAAFLLTSDTVANYGYTANALKLDWSYTVFTNGTTNRMALATASTATSAVTASFSKAFLEIKQNN